MAMLDRAATILAHTRDYLPDTDFTWTEAFVGNCRAATNHSNSGDYLPDLDFTWTEAFVGNCSASPGLKLL